MENKKELDARGLLCPLPVLKAAKKMRSMATGDTLVLLTDDPAAVVDVPHYCTESGNELLEMTASNGGHAFTLRKT